MPGLRLPSTLAFVIVSAGAVVGAACDGDGPHADARPEPCQVTCVSSPFFDDGGLVGDAGVTCPACADELDRCPSGCYPIGLA